MNRKYKIKVSLFSRLLAIFISVLFISSCRGLFSSTKDLPKDNWDKTVHQSLSEMIMKYGNPSKDYDSLKKAYAVFDFDNTTIINDVSLTLFIYQIENLIFKITPEQMYEVITSCVPDVDKALNLDNPKVLTSRMLAEDITSDYLYLYDNYINKAISYTKRDKRVALKQIHQTDEYLDFRAKLWSLSLGIAQTFDYGIGCLWLPSLFTGMTKEEVTSLSRVSYHYWNNKKIKREIWTGPDKGKCGQVKVTITEGIAITKEIKNLYKALTENGIDVYICSAAMEEIVEGMACCPTSGLNIKEENVFGVRLKTDSSGLFIPHYDSTYTQSYKEGKVDVINKYISPLYGNQAPLLVAGDSNGDYAMLSSYPDLKIGLIINCLRNAGPILQLYEKAINQKRQNTVTTRYLLQGRNDNKARFISSSQSIPLQ